MKAHATYYIQWHRSGKHHLWYMHITDGVTHENPIGGVAMMMITLRAWLGVK